MDEEERLFCIDEGESVLECIEREIREQQVARLEQETFEEYLPGQSYSTDPPQSPQGLT